MTDALDKARQDCWVCKQPIGNGAMVRFCADDLKTRAHADIETCVAELLIGSDAAKKRIAELERENNALTDELDMREQEDCLDDDELVKARTEAHQAGFLACQKAAEEEVRSYKSAKASAAWNLAIVQAAQAISQLKPEGE
jgi:hypothetical protein